MAYILVLDDASEIQFILKEVLASDGHTVSCAENGKVGMSLAAKNRFDIVITDIVMPEMDGFEVITEIRKCDPDIKIIAMTGGSARLDREFLEKIARSMHTDKVISKPINFKELRSTVADMLNV
jgi:CheY-like chemotaxis protein